MWSRIKSLFSSGLSFVKRPEPDSSEHWQSYEMSVDQRATGRRFAKILVSPEGAENLTAVVARVFSMLRNRLPHQLIVRGFAPSQSTEYPKGAPAYIMALDSDDVELAELRNEMKSGCPDDGHNWGLFASSAPMLLSSVAIKSILRNGQWLSELPIDADLRVVFTKCTSEFEFDVSEAAGSWVNDAVLHAATEGGFSRLREMWSSNTARWMPADSGG